MRLRGISKNMRRFSSANALSCKNSFWITKCDDETSTFLIGIRDQFIEKHVLGNIDKIHYNKEDQCLSIEWSGLAQSDGDELYHTRWGNTEGSLKLTLNEMLTTNSKIQLLEYNKDIEKSPDVNLLEMSWIFKFREI